MTEPADQVLQGYRQSIDNIDAALVHMLAERFKVTQAVGRHKATHGLPPAIPVARNARSPACANWRPRRSWTPNFPRIPEIHHRRGDPPPRPDAGVTGFLLAIEGGDGAGKATAAAEVAAQLKRRRPHGDSTVLPALYAHAGRHVLGDYLAGRLPHTASPRAMATLYALDRLESAAVIAAAAATHEVVVFDRYIASNMAYQAAQVPAGEARDLMAWIARLEVAPVWPAGPRPVGLSRHPRPTSPAP